MGIKEYILKDNVKFRRPYLIHCEKGVLYNIMVYINFIRKLSFLCKYLSFLFVMVYGVMNFIKTLILILS